MCDNGDGTWSGSFRIPDLHAAMLRKAVQAFAAPRRRHLGDGTGDPAAPVRTLTDPLGLGFVELIERFPADRLPGPAVSTPSWSSR